MSELTNSSWGAETEKVDIMAACMMEQLDHLVEHDGDGRHTHAMLKGEREKTKGIQWCSMQTLGCFRQIRQRVRLQLFLSLYGKTQSHSLLHNV